MSTYAAYVAQSGRLADDVLNGWAVKNLRQVTVEDLAHTLADRLRINEATYDEAGQWMKEVTPFVPTDGVEIHLPATIAGDASQFLALVPSRSTAEPALAYLDREIVFRVNDPARARATLDAVKRNIDERNKDIRREESNLQTHMTNVAQAAIRRADESQAEAERSMKAIEESGIPVRRELASPQAAAPAETPPTRVALRVIQDSADLSDALAIIQEMRRHARTAADSGRLNDSGQELVEVDLLPLLDELEMLIGSRGEDPRERTRLVHQALAVAGRVQQGAVDAGRFIVEGANVVGGISVLIVAAEHLPALAAQVPNILRSISG